MVADEMPVCGLSRRLGLVTLQKFQGSEPVSLVTLSCKDECPRQHGRSFCLFCPTFRSHAASLLSQSIKHVSPVCQDSSEKGRDSTFGWEECQGQVIENDNGDIAVSRLLVWIYDFFVHIHYFLAYLYSLHTSSYLIVYSTLYKNSGG